MRKSRTFVPRCDEANLEGRVALSTVFGNFPFVHATPPVRQFQINFTSRTYHFMIQSLKQIARNLAVTGNVTAAENALARQSFRVPFGNQNLLPMWQADLESLPSPTVAQALNVVVSDLNNYLESNVGTTLNILKSHQGWATDNALNGFYNGRV
jgi:hypothetical protein